MQLFPQNKVEQLVSGAKKISLNTPRLVGILNITPDSFSDGGQYLEPESALQHAQEMIEHGADWIDIGGESSGPNSKEISVEEELRRVLPVIKAIRQKSDIWLSIDTWKAEVARQALALGVDAVNDVTALRGDPGMGAVLKSTKCPVILMYSKDASARTSTLPVVYEDVVSTIRTFFKERLIWMQLQGISLENIVLDPGMGFFVSGHPGYSLEIIKRLEDVTNWGFPVLLGPSRKSFLANISPFKTLSVHDRETPSLTVAAIAIWKGVSFIRLHDVRAGRLMLDTLKAIQQGAS